MKRYKTTITLTENQIEALNSVFQWLIPHRNEFVDTGHRAGILQIEKKLNKAEQAIDIHKAKIEKKYFSRNAINYLDDDEWEKYS